MRRKGEEKVRAMRNRSVGRLESEMSAGDKMRVEAVVVAAMSKSGMASFIVRVLVSSGWRCWIVSI